MDYKSLFSHVNKVICTNIEEIFPGGRVDNRGWYQLSNFDRGDRKPGTFGICVQGDKLGAVNDFADPSYKSDATGFYARVNDKKMLEAAREVLKKYDTMAYEKYFPPKNKIKYTPITPIPKDANLEEYLNNDPDLSNNVDFIYEYHDVAGRVLYYSVRVKTPIKKQNWDKPRKVFSVGYFDMESGDNKWQDFTWYRNPFKGKPFPFSRIPELMKHGKRNTIIVEGEKAAHYLESILDRDKWIVTCIGSSSYMLNAKSYEVFEKAKIYHAFYWPDNDEAGRKTIGFVKERFDKLSVVKIPEDIPEKWDAADAVLDGWDEKKIENFIYGNLYETEEIDPQFFKAFAHDHENFYFMSYRLGLVKVAKQETITTGFLRILAPREYWANKYPSTSEKSTLLYDADSAIESIVEMGLQTPYHENGKIRQIGAWNDDGRLVFHYGEGLLVNGRKVGLFNFETENIYEKKGYLSFIESENSDVDLKVLAKIIGRFAISSPKEKYLFLGWVFMSIAGGVLKWRPHIWLTGEPGSGKTSAIEFLDMLFGSAIIKETGSSSEAGIRQRMKNSTLPILIDELEDMDDKTGKNLKSIKALIRQASSGTRVSKGTQNHAGIDFTLFSMFCVGSVSPQIAENADLTRFAIINFDKSQMGSPKDWMETEQMMEEEITKEYTDALKLFVTTHLREIIDSVNLAFRCFGELGYNSRMTQLYATLAMGAFICQTNGFDFTADEFYEFVGKKFNFDEESGKNMSTEAEKCLSIVMQKIIDYKQGDNSNDKNSIYELLKMYFVEKDKVATENPDIALMGNIIKAVKSYGFLVDNKYNEDDILFVYNAANVKEILKNSIFSGDIKEILKRHPKATGILGKTVYAGSNGSAIRLSRGILNEDLETVYAESGEIIPF